MKKLFFIAFVCLAMNVSAGVKSGDNPDLSKKEKKSSKAAMKRVVNFYNWYINYINVNHVRPTQHIVLNQNVSASMRRNALANSEKYDVFLASSNFDSGCEILMIPERVEKNRINLKAEVTGKNHYSFHIDMVMQKDSWCIDIVVPDEDIDPRLDEAK